MMKWRNGTAKRQAIFYQLVSMMKRSILMITGKLTFGPGNGLRDKDGSHKAGDKITGCKQHGCTTMKIVEMMTWTFKK
eukprot:4928794-Prorocentrum_lima.AAC.1